MLTSSCNAFVLTDNSKNCSRDEVMENLFLNLLLCVTRSVRQIGRNRDRTSNDRTSKDQTSKDWLSKDWTSTDRTSKDWTSNRTEPRMIEARKWPNLVWLNLENGVINLI